MAEYIFKMPDIGEGIVETEIVEWHVKPGESVAEDAPLADVMTDKATVEITSPVTGTVKQTGCVVGEKIGIGANFVIFDVATPVDEAAPAPVSRSPEKTVELQEPAVTPAPSEPVVADKPRLRVTPDTEPVNQSEAVISQPETEGKPSAAPAVRRRARELGLDLSRIRGSGPKGRVLAADLEQLPPHSGTSRKPDTPTRIPITGLRRMIGERLVESARAIPHFSYVEEVDITELESLRKHLNENSTSDQPRLSLLHFTLLGVCRSVLLWPQCNAHYDDEGNELIQYPDVHLGVATMTDAGLVVPVVRHADTLTVWQLASEVQRLADGARNKNLPPDELTGSTITVTSLGRLAGLVTTPIINRPETTIIGPNKMTEKLVLNAGQVTTRQVMNISSSFDHRIVDGQDAALLIQDLKNRLEHPAMLFMS